jgi:hypothetical protein
VAVPNGLKVASSDSPRYGPEALAVPASQAAFPRGLLAETGDLPRTKPLWSLGDATEVIETLAARGVAISEGQFLRLTEDGIEPLPQGRTRKAAAFLAGPSTWHCERAPVQRWPLFVRRCAQMARAEVRFLLSRAGRDRIYVDLACVTEDELTCFDIPGYVREATRRDLGDGRLPDALILAPTVDATRVRWAGPAAPGSFYGDPAGTLADAPLGARALCVSGRAKDIRKLATFTSLEALWAADVDQQGLDVISRLASLRFLILSEARRVSLKALRRLNRLEYLECRSGRFTDVAGLAQLSRLRVLCINIRKLGDLTDVGRLSRLRGLAFVTGGPGAPAPLRSLAPLARLTGLRHLSLGHIRLTDARLDPLTALTRLRRLDISNRFPREEFAKLAAALPRTDGPHRSPFFTDSLLAPLLTCGKCGVRTKLTTLGKPARWMCPECDAAKMRRFVADWEILVSSKRAQVARRRAGR